MEKCSAFQDIELPLQYLLLGLPAYLLPRIDAVSLAYHRALNSGDNNRFFLPKKDHRVSPITATLVHKVSNRYPTKYCHRDNKPKDNPEVLTVIPKPTELPHVLVNRHE